MRGASTLSTSSSIWPNWNKNPTPRNVHTKLASAGTRNHQIVALTVRPPKPNPFQADADQRSSQDLARYGTMLTILKARLPEFTASEMFRLAAFAIVAFELHRHVADVELMFEQRGHVAEYAVLVGGASDHRVR